MAETSTPLVGIIMGSDSDLPTLQPAAEVCAQFGVAYEIRVVSAHRTPADMAEYATQAHQHSLKVIIAGAGGAAHLPGMVAAYTPLPCNWRASAKPGVTRSGLATIYRPDAVRCASGDGGYRWRPQRWTIGGTNPGDIRPNLATKTAGLQTGIGGGVAG